MLDDLKKFVGWLCWILIFALALAELWQITPIGRDDSDEPGWGRGRSNMKVHVDATSGCEYLSVHGGLTPRLDTHGKQWCDSRK